MLGTLVIINFTLVKPCNFVYVYTVMKMGNLNRRGRARLDSFEVNECDVYTHSFLPCGVKILVFIVVVVVVVASYVEERV